MYRVHPSQVCTTSSIQEENHNRALGLFLSKELHQYVNPRLASLIRPGNFNKGHFQTNSDLVNMYSLLKQCLCTFFMKYKLSSIQVVSCISGLWESILPLRRLEMLDGDNQHLRVPKFCIDAFESNVKTRKKILRIWMLLLLMFAIKFRLLKKQVLRLADVIRILYQNRG